MSNNGYISEFAIEAIDMHQNFTAASWTMPALSSGTDSISSDSAQIIGALSSIGIVAATYSNQTTIYTATCQTTSNVRFVVSSLTISIVENNVLSITPDLTCSADGTTSITYTSSATQSWISLDSNTGLLTVTAPEVTSDTEYDFYINSTVSGYQTQIQRQVKLTVINCSVQNCQKWSSSSGTSCAVWNPVVPSTSEPTKSQNTTSGAETSGIAKTSGTVETSGTAKTIGTATASVSWALFVIVAVQSTFNVASMASFWSMINQMQMFFLLLLSRSFIPQDVKATIQGSKFALNLFGYIPFSNLSVFSSVISTFDFELTNPLLDDVGISSDGIIYNIYPFITVVISVLLVHLLIYFLMLWSLNMSEDEEWTWFVKIYKRILEKLYRIMTFGYYIRNVIQMSQYMLIWAIYEIYKFNTDGLITKVSLIWAFISMIVYFLFIGAALYLIVTSYRVEENQHNKLGEFFSGLQSTKGCRFYVIVMLGRKTVFIAILLTLVSVSGRVILIILSVLQLVYLIYICIMRPFSEKKGNVIEILNEIYFFLLLFSLVFMYQESNWSSTKISIYIWAIASNSIVILLLISSKITFNLSHSWRFMKSHQMGL